MKNIAICVITYNRLHSLKRVLESLDNAYYEHSVELIISIDKSNSDKCLNYSKNFEWKHGDKRIIEHSENLGLRKHVLSCGDLLYEDKYEALVVLEDDITVAPSFFYYAEQCVDKYWDNNDIAGISLYRFPINYINHLPFTPLQTDSDVYLQQTAMSWGQVWMKYQWMEFREWYKDNDEEFSVAPHLPKRICQWRKSSWLKYHSRYCIEQNKYFVYPYVSLSTNNGDSGTHNQSTSSSCQTPLLYGEKKDFFLNPTVKYDGFFENELIYDILGYDKKRLCIDFYGDKGNRENCRYWLSAKELPYKLVRSYELTLKPYEQNIICNREGNGLYLYDTNFIERKKCKDTLNAVKYYLYAANFEFKYQIRQALIMCYRKIRNK